MEFYKYHSLGNDYLVYDIQKNRAIQSGKPFPFIQKAGK